MSVLQSQTNLLKMWDQAGAGFAGKGLWGAAATPVGPVNLGWDPLTAAPFVTLTNGNLTMEAAPPINSAGVLGVQSQNNGTRYFEIELEAPYIIGSITTFLMGVGTPGMNLSDPYTPGAFAFDFMRADGQWMDNSGAGGLLTVFPTSAFINSAHTIGVVVDFSIPMINWLCDGIDLLTPTVILAAPGATLYPAALSGVAGQFLTLRNTAAEFTQAIPPGALPWVT